MTVAGVEVAVVEFRDVVPRSVTGDPAVRERAVADGRRVGAVGVERVEGVSPADEVAPLGDDVGGWSCS